MEGDVPSKKSKMNNRFEVEQWHAVALWSYDIELDLCTICRNHVRDLCIECQAEATIGKKKTDCKIAWGRCNHAFHLHCIAQWLHTKKVCPLDNSDWQYKKKTGR